MIVDSHIVIGFTPKGEEMKWLCAIEYTLWRTPISHLDAGNAMVYLQDKVQ